MNTHARITAVLGATNTGKTHYAIERLLARKNGVIGLPLRLLAREVYDKAVRLKGKSACALITGEEKILPPHAQYFICTVEAMPMADILAGKFAAVVVDEIQMVTHPERGHIFCDRLLRARGTEETLLLGANTVRPIVEALVPEARYHTRERFSVLSYTGPTKITRLPKRTILVAFSANDVYAHAEIVRRHYGGAAVIMGGLSPRTRNAQALLYQSGEVDYLIATDAIGMGLNLDADHVAFAALRKFDGQRRRYLKAHEIGQIAGRAGRFRTNGSFGTTGRALPLDDDIAVQIENHDFEPIQSANWRSTQLDYTTPDALLESLAQNAPSPLLRRTAPVLDELVFERLLKFHDYKKVLNAPETVKHIWNLCQIPDFRNLGVEAHSRLVDELATHMRNHGDQVDDGFFQKAIARLNHTDGNIEILSSRLAAIRTWAYIANKTEWLRGEKKWIEPTRKVEDSLSDALHTKLVQRFVDRRTSALIKGMRRKTNMEIEIKPTGEVCAEGHQIGELNGLSFKIADGQNALEDKTLRAAAELAIGPEIDKKLIQIAGAEHGQFALNNQGEFVWGDNSIAKLAIGPSLLNPDVQLIGGELGSAALRTQAQARVKDYLRTEIGEKFADILALKTFIDDPNAFKPAKPLARLLYENAGIIRRSTVREIVNSADRQARNYIRGMGGRITTYFIFMQGLMRPGASRLMSLIFAFAWDKDGGGGGNPFLPRNGPSSTPAISGFSEAVLNRAGFTRQGPRIIRLDILETLFRMIRHGLKSEKYGEGQFRIAQQMMAALGCNYEDLRGVLKSLSYEPFMHTLSPEEYETEHAHYKPLKKYVPLSESEKAELIKRKQAEAAIPEQPSSNDDAAQPGEDDGAPISTAPASAQEATNPKPGPVQKVHKMRRKIVLDDYFPPPEFDADGKAITPTQIELWRHVKKRGRKAHDHKEGKNIRPTPRYAYQVGPNSRPSHTPPDGETVPAQKSRTKPMSRQEKIAKYTKLSQPKTSTKSGNAKPVKKNTEGHSKSKPIEDSPFAALAALKLDQNKKTGDKNE